MCRLCDLELMPQAERDALYAREAKEMRNAEICVGILFAAIAICIVVGIVWIGMSHG